MAGYGLNVSSRANFLIFFDLRRQCDSTDGKREATGKGKGCGCKLSLYMGINSDLSAGCRRHHMGVGRMLIRGDVRYLLRSDGHLKYLGQFDDDATVKG